MARPVGGGATVALVSDAGSPGISDPGERLVAAAVDAGVLVTAVPGPAAAVMAVSISGLPTGRWVFEGFLPRSGAARKSRLAEVAAERRTTVLYEAPHRLIRSIDELRAACGGDRRIVLARELTKLHEEVCEARSTRPSSGARRSIPRVSTCSSWPARPPRPLPTTTPSGPRSEPASPPAPRPSRPSPR
ncbi:MAG: SAM-dependent methyltransferase [Ilumatobacteraceae bacterium]